VFRADAQALQNFKPENDVFMRFLRDSTDLVEVLFAAN
jgi:hypothetical protein